MRCGKPAFHAHFQHHVSNAQGVQSAAGVNKFLMTPQMQITDPVCFPTPERMIPQCVFKNSARAAFAVIQCDFSLFKWMSWKLHRTESHRNHMGTRSTFLCYSGVNQHLKLNFGHKHFHLDIVLINRKGYNSILSAPNATGNPDITFANVAVTSSLCGK